MAVLEQNFKTSGSVEHSTSQGEGPWKVVENFTETRIWIERVIGHPVDEPVGVVYADGAVAVAKLLTFGDYCRVMERKKGNQELMGRTELRDGVLATKPVALFGPGLRHGSATWAVRSYFDREVLCIPISDGKIYFWNIGKCVLYLGTNAQNMESGMVPDIGFMPYGRRPNSDLSTPLNFIVEVADSGRLQSLMDDILYAERAVYDSTGKLMRSEKRVLRSFCLDALEDVQQVSTEHKTLFPNWPIITMSACHLFAGVDHDGLPMNKPDYTFSVIRLAETLRKVIDNVKAQKRLSPLKKGDVGDFPAKWLTPARCTLEIARVENESYKAATDTEVKRRAAMVKENESQEANLTDPEFTWHDAEEE